MQAGQRRCDHRPLLLPETPLAPFQRLSCGLWQPDPEGVSLCSAENQRGDSPSRQCSGLAPLFCSGSPHIWLTTTSVASEPSLVRSGAGTQQSTVLLAGSAGHRAAGWASAVLRQRQGAGQVAARSRGAASVRGMAAGPNTTQPSTVCTDTYQPAPLLPPLLTCGCRVHAGRDPASDALQAHRGVVLQGRCGQDHDGCEPGGGARKA